MGDMTDFNNRLLVMTAGGANPNVMINALATRFPDIHVFMEQPEVGDFPAACAPTGLDNRRRPDGDDDRLTARQTLHGA